MIKTENEEWKDIEGFNGYKCSTLGRVMSFRKNKNGIVLNRKSTCKDGYLHANLRSNSGKLVSHSIHIWIATTFLKNPDTNTHTIINHKNGIKIDNNVANLEYMTPSQNTQHACDILNVKKSSLVHKQEYFDFESHKHEDWRNIDNHRNYMCNCFGDIIHFNKDKCIRLTHTKTKYGYLRVTLLHNCGKRKSYFVHRIIATLFVKNPNDLPYINHINGNKADNAINNIEWCNQIDNVKHTHKTLNLISKKGEMHGCAKLSDNQVKEIITLLESGVSVIEIVKKYRACKVTIENIKFRRQWKHIPRHILFERNTHSNSKMSDNKVIEIYKICWLKTISQYKIANKFNITQATVNDIMHGKTWSSVTGHIRKGDMPNWNLINGYNISP